MAGNRLENGPERPHITESRRRHASTRQEGRIQIIWWGWGALVLAGAGIFKFIEWLAHVGR